MAGNRWIKAATANAHGQFRAKAQGAGMSTRAYAEKEKGSGGATGKQAVLALNLMGASKGGGGKRNRAFQKAKGKK